jgi:anti-sigma factor RsiW
VPGKLAKDSDDYVSSQEPVLRCVEVQKVIDAFVDGESDAVTSHQIEEHFQICTLCWVARENREVLRSLIRRRSGAPYTRGRYRLYYEAPVQLRTRIRAALRPASISNANHRLCRWLIAAASVALVAVSIFAVTLVSRRDSAQDLLVREVISSHVRSFMADRLTDMLSSDEHTMETWFHSRLDFAPSVENLADKEFPLQGGRIEYLGNRPIAVLVYRHREHVINVFIWPSENDSELPNKRMMRQGYNVIFWTRTGMECCAVSDLDINDLQGFAQVFKERYSQESPN